MSSNRQAKRATGRPTGRPSIYTDALATKILVRIAEGEPLSKICKDPAMPSLATVYGWLDAPAKAEREGKKKAPISAGFVERYARAREDAADTLAAEILEIADDGSRDYKTVIGKDGEPIEVVDQDHIQRSRLRVDARKWIAAKLKPKKYGERVTQEVTGAEGGPIQTESVVVDVQASLAKLREKLKGAV